jgi:MSHA biogenesis protein MshK
MKRISHQVFAYLMQNTLKLLLNAACGLLLSIISTDVLAEILKDPTQPPAAFSNPTSHENSPVTGPVLQSVMIGPQYHAAIINGQKIMLGGQYQNATLIKVSEREVVLRSADKSTQTLLMDYAVIKKTSPAMLPKTKN